MLVITLAIRAAPGARAGGGEAGGDGSRGKKERGTGGQMGRRLGGGWRCPWITITTWECWSTESKELIASWADHFWLGLDFWVQPAPSGETASSSADSARRRNRPSLLMMSVGQQPISQSCGWPRPTGTCAHALGPSELTWITVGAACCRLEPSACPQGCCLTHLSERGTCVKGADT